MFYAVQYLTSLVVFLLVIVATGWTLERAFLRVDRGRGIAWLCSGFAFWTLGVFVLLALRLFNGFGLISLLGLLALIAIWNGRRGRFSPTDLRVERWDLICSGLLGVLLLPIAMLAMSPPVSWDANVYHLSLPKLFVDSGGFETPLFSVYAHWPLGTELLFTLALWAKDYILAKLIHFLFGALLLWALVRAGRERFTTAWPGIACGALAALFFLANPVVAFEMRVAYVDLAQAFFTLAAFLFLERALDAVENVDDQSRFLMLTGLCCGLVAGTKVTGISLAAILALTFFVSRWNTASLGGTASMLARSFAPPVLMLWLPWIFKSWWTTGNPIYPLLHGIFGGPHWTAELGDQFSSWQRAIGMGREPIDFLFLPLRVIFAGGKGYERFDGELGVFWIFVLPLALLAARKRTDVRRLLGVSALLFVFWALTSQQMRFLIPVLPLLALASAVSMGELIRRWPYRQVILGVLVVAVLGLNGWMHQQLLDAGFKTLKLLDERPKTELLASAVHPIYQTLNEQLPENAKLLLLNTNHTFFVERDYVADSFFEASQIRSWLALAQTPQELFEQLRAEGITHILFEFRETGIAWPNALMTMLTDRRWTDALERSPDGRFLLLALRPAIG